MSANVYVSVLATLELFVSLFLRLRNNTCLTRMIKLECQKSCPCKRSKCSTVEFITKLKIDCGGVVMLLCTGAVEAGESHTVSF